MLRFVTRHACRAVPSSLLLFAVLASGCNGGGSSSSLAPHLASTAAPSTSASTPKPTAPAPQPGAVPGGITTTPKPGAAPTPVTPPTTPPGTPPSTAPGAAPALILMAPTSGAPGSIVTILAANVGAKVGITFGTLPAAQSASVTKGAVTSFATVVPTGATTGHVYLYDQASGKTVDCGVFTIGASTPPPPVTPAPPPPPITLPPRPLPRPRPGPMPRPLPPTTPPTTPGTGPSIVSATLEDTNGNNVVDAGDTLTITFDREVTLQSSDPTGQIDLLVPGDSFGLGATMDPGTVATDVVITLGSSPHILVTGTYDPYATGNFQSSGVDVDPACNAIVDANGYTPVATTMGVDVASTTFAEGSYTLAASLNNARGLHSATLLNDGRVLIVGGITSNGPGSSFYQLECEVFDPMTNTFTNLSDPTFGSAAPTMQHYDQSGASFTIGRYAHAAVVLDDGTSYAKVLIAGGHGYEDRDATGAPVYGELTSCFIFDPATMSFTETGALSHPRRDGQAVYFSGGQVMIFGGRDADGTLATSEIWDPASGTWSPGPSMVVDRYDDVVVPTTLGIVIAGGASQTGRQTQSPTLTNVVQDENYDASMGYFTALGSSLNYARRAACGTSFESGNVLVAGGNDDSGAALSSVELYDATTSTFTTIGSLGTARARASAKRIWDDVAVVGGMEYDASGHVSSLASLETVTEQGVTASFPLNDQRLSSTVTHLQDGRLLIVGGFGYPTSDVRGMDGYATGSAEVYTRP